MKSATQAATETVASDAPADETKAVAQVHFLKSWPDEYVRARDGLKPFEIRRDDRTPRFETGDVVVLQEFDPERAAFTGSGWLVFSIGHVERSKCLPEGWCGFALEKATAKQKRASVDAAMSGKGSK